MLKNIITPILCLFVFTSCCAYDGKEVKTTNEKRSQEQLTSDSQSARTNIPLTTVPVSDDGNPASFEMAHAISSGDVQQRIDNDLENGKPIVVHVIVALCDNAHQGIVRVSESLGNGQNVNTNLYWGAMYGFRSFLTNPNQANFKVVSCQDSPVPGVLQKMVLYKQIKRSNVFRDVLVVGEAWDGREMEKAVKRFLSIAAGNNRENNSVAVNERQIAFSSGGASALVVFIGHNGLMDFELEALPDKNPDSQAKSSVVLACASKPYFLDILLEGGSHPLILTTGLMAPEAYTLEAVINAFVTGKTSSGIKEAAAAAYQKYQKCPLSAARRLFYAEP